MDTHPDPAQVVIFGASGDLTLHKLMPALASLCLLGMTVSACGPEAPQTADGTSTSTGGGGSSSDAPTGSSTGAPEPCSLVHEGDLTIVDGTDLDSLANVGRVTGNLGMRFKLRELRDLSFLSCVHTIDGRLEIVSSPFLESTEGLENLKSVESITILYNKSLREVTGFEKIHELVGLEIVENPSLEMIEFKSLEIVDQLRIGVCYGTEGLARHYALGELSGFSSLTTVRDLHIEGNETMVSADLLDSLAANGAPLPLRYATIRYNYLLSESAVHEQLDALGVTFRDVCGNAGGDPECYCLVD